MDGQPTIARTAVRSITRNLAIAAVLAFPASASAPALAETGARVETAARGDSFSTSFAAVGSPKTRIVPAAGAVDVTRIDPADEPEAPAATARLIGSGVASFYGNELAGNRTASGERFDPAQRTAAHRTLPFGTKVRVTNAANGKSVVVRINDRGPFHGNRVIDLSKSAAAEIGLVARGSGRVDMAVLDN